MPVRFVCQIVHIISKMKCFYILHFALFLYVVPGTDSHYMSAIAFFLLLLLLLTHFSPKIKDFNLKLLQNCFWWNAFQFGALINILKVPRNLSRGDMINSRWLPKWPPKFKISHILLSRADRKMT